MAVGSFWENIGYGLYQGLIMTENSGIIFSRALSGLDNYRECRVSLFTGSIGA